MLNYEINKSLFYGVVKFLKFRDVYLNVGGILGGIIKPMEEKGAQFDSVYSLKKNTSR